MTAFLWFWAGIGALVVGVLMVLYYEFRRRPRYESKWRDELIRFESELLNTFQPLILRQSDDWLKELYKAHTDRFTKENDKIWETGKILLPLSLGGFAAYGAVPERTGSQIFALAVASIGLLLIWHLVAARHRRFQDIHRSWSNAIERTLGIDVSRPEVKSLLKLNFESIRRLFLYGMSILWLGLLWQYGCKHLPCAFYCFNSISCP